MNVLLDHLLETQSSTGPKKAIAVDQINEIKLPIEAWMFIGWSSEPLTARSLWPCQIKTNAGGHLIGLYVAAVTKRETIGATTSFPMYCL